MEDFVMLYLMIGFFMVTIALFAEWESIQHERFSVLLLVVILGTLIWPYGIYRIWKDGSGE